MLVPVTTMAEHLRNQLARETFVFSPRAISTFGKFAGEFASELDPVTGPALELILTDCLRTLPFTRYASVRDFPGFRSALARAVEDFSGAGGTAAHIDVTEPDFQLVWKAAQAEVDRRNLHFRVSRLRQAAAQIRKGGDLGFLWVAGFFDFTPAEIEVLRALDERATLVVTAPETLMSRASLQALRSFAGDEIRLQVSIAPPTRVLFRASTIDGEANEIARRIAEHLNSGFSLRDIGVVVRSEMPLVPALRAAFERFGIPSRSYFTSPLRSDAAVRYLVALVDAALGGWDHEATLRALRMHGSPLEESGDKFEYRVYEGLPRRGFQGLRDAIPGLAPDFFERLEPLGEWASSAATPEVWSARFHGLRHLFRTSPITDRVDPERALLWKRQHSALEQFAAVIDETAAFFDGSKETGCREFRDALVIAMSSVQIHVVDRRSDVVHIMDAVEARQWRLPVMFVSGLVEQQFPMHHPEDPVLSDSVRGRLQAMGIPVRTTAERQAQEQQLFDVLLTRATDHVCFSYAMLNAKGDRQLPSFFLEALGTVEAQPAVPVKPPPVRARAVEPVASLRDPALLRTLSERHSALSPGKIEEFLTCPYRFFVTHTLKLRRPPAKVWDRLTPPVQGTIGHSVFEFVFRDGISGDQAFDQAFAERCREAGIPEGYRTEAIRLELLYGIELLLRDQRLGPGTGESLFEQTIRFPLTRDLQITGRIDRLDIDPDGRAVIFDYKYKRKIRIELTAKENEEGKRVQSGLYLLGAAHLGHQPAGMVYSGFKREASVSGWVLHGVRQELNSSCSPSHLDEVIGKARETAIAAHAEIVGGVIDARPVDLKACEFCSCSTVCRVEVTPIEAAVESNAAQ